MIKKLAGFFAAAILVILLVPGAASAHVLKIDGDIGAVLHINPDDNPTSGSPTDYILSFDDDTGRFNLAHCKCNVSIIENGSKIATQPLVVSGSEISENKYTFTKPDAYTMRITGRPKTPGDFQPFTLNYDVRVTGQHNPTQPIPFLLWLGMGLGVGLILLAAYAMEYNDL